MHVLTRFANSSGLFMSSIIVFIALFGIAFLGLAIFEIVASWIVYKKAHRPGWACIIPLYNTWVLAKIGGKPGWWGLFPLLFWIPVLGTIPGIILSILICIGIAKNFGRSTAFGVIGLWLFSAVGYPMLAFGPDEYRPSAANQDTISPLSPSSTM